MTRLRVAVFASVRRIMDVVHTVQAALREASSLPAAAQVSVRGYRAPDHLLGHLLVMAEYAVARRRPMTAAACGQGVASVVTRFIGELTERIALSGFHPAVRRQASERQLRAEGLTVFDTGSYLGEPMFPEKWPFPLYSPERTCSWIVGEELATGEKMYLPLLLCLPRATLSEVWCELTSVGSAAGHTVEQATRHAIREIFERDALRFAWFAGHTMTLVDPPGPWENLRDLDTALGWRTRFFRARTRIEVPLWVVCTRHRKLPLAAIGASCSDHIVEGPLHALAEALQGRLYIWLTRERQAPSESVCSFLDHASYYADERRIADLDLLFGDGLSDDCGDNDPDMETLTGAVRLRLHDDDRAAVVRVLHPRAQPVEADHAAARLVGRTRTFPRNRLRTAPTPFA